MDWLVSRSVPSASRNSCSPCVPHALSFGRRLFLQAVRLPHHALIRIAGVLSYQSGCACDAETQEARTRGEGSQEAVTEWVLVSPCCDLSNGLTFQYPRSLIFFRPCKARKVKWSVQ
jgi:hypothetical protein